MPPRRRARRGGHHVLALVLTTTLVRRGQIENEYGNIDSAYGAAGKAYMRWAAGMAVSLDTGVPWVMCQQADAPDPLVRVRLVQFPTARNGMNGLPLPVPDHTGTARGGCE